MGASDYSSARKEPTGYTHLLSLKWNGDSVSDWTPLVSKWGQIRRRISDEKNAFVGGIADISLADTEENQPLWGSFYGPSGTTPLWSDLEIQSKIAGPGGTFSYPDSGEGAIFGQFRFGALKFGQSIFSQRIAAGRVVRTVSEENVITLSLSDDIDRLSKAKFLWDYENLNTSQEGEIYGTVFSISRNGTAVVMAIDPLETLREKLNTISAKPEYRTYTQIWKRFIETNEWNSYAIFPGDVIKFAPDNLDADESRTNLIGSKGFNVTLGTQVGTFATLSFTRPISGVSEGDYIYKRKPLIFSGNPAEIIRTMLTGNNTDIDLPSGSISNTFFIAATSACMPMNFRGLIIDDTEGAVLNAIKEISEPLDAQYYFNRSGKWIWMPYRPRVRSGIDDISDHYDAVSGGTDNIAGGARWQTDLENTYSAIEMSYMFNEFEDEKGIAYQDTLATFNTSMSNSHYGWVNDKHIKTSWVQSKDEAAIILARYKKNHGTARQGFEILTSLYGLEQDIYDLVRVTHRTGSLNETIFQVNETVIDLDGDAIFLELDKIHGRHIGSGFIFWKPVNEVPILARDVTGTSKGGWGWPITEGPGTHGTVDAVVTDQYLDLRYNDGEIPEVGNDGYTQWITIGSEIIKVVSNKASQNKLVYRGQHTTGTNGPGGDVWDLVGIGWTAWSQDENGDPEFLYPGTILNVPEGDIAANPGIDRMMGTVHDINTATNGTVGKFW